MSLHHQRCSDKLSLPLLMDFILPKIVFLKIVLLLKDYYYMYNVLYIRSTKEGKFIFEFCFMHLYYLILCY